MSHDHACVEDRIAKLEASVEAMTKRLNEISISPDGVTFKGDRCTITIDAAAGGIWVEGKDKSMACLYSVPHEGAVVGVYGQPDAEGKRRGALDAALYYDPRLGEASLQLMKADNTHFVLTPEETGEGTRLKMRPKA